MIRASIVGRTGLAHFIPSTDSILIDTTGENNLQWALITSDGQARTIAWTPNPPLETEERKAVV